MDGDILAVTILVGMMGLGGLLFGVAILTGRIKAWWLAQSIPGIVPEAAFYFGIPMGVTLLALALSLLLPDSMEKGWGSLDIVGGLFIISIIITLWRPPWLRPKWLRWLEDNHRSILSLLRREAREMGGPAWEERVRTQEDLEQWVEEVRRKHGLT
jgi:uncharacterized membrane protein YccC